MKKAQVWAAAQSRAVTYALLKTSVEERRLKLRLWTMYRVLFQGKEKYQLELELRPLFPSSLQVWCFCNATEAVVGIKRWGLFLLPGGISWITHSIFYVPQSVHYHIISTKEAEGEGGVG